MKSILLIEPLLLLFSHCTLIFDMWPIIVDNPHKKCYSAQSSLSLILFIYFILCLTGLSCSSCIVGTWLRYNLIVHERLTICSCLSITGIVLKIRALSTFIIIWHLMKNMGCESMWSLWLYDQTTQQCIALFMFQVMLISSIREDLLKKKFKIRILSKPFVEICRAFIELKFLCFFLSFFLYLSLNPNPEMRKCVAMQPLAAEISCLHHWIIHILQLKYYGTYKLFIYMNIWTL